MQRFNRAYSIHPYAYDLKSINYQHKIIAKMRKLFYLFALLFTASFIFTACNENDEPEVPPLPPNQVDEGVVINGVRWATRNVDAPGTFADNPEDAGMFFQWNRRVGWSTDNPLINSDGGTIWDSSTPEGTAWYAENDPCPSLSLRHKNSEVKFLYFCCKKGKDLTG